MIEGVTKDGEVVTLSRGRAQRIYIIRAKAGPVKIGIANDPRARLRTLRTASYSELFLEFSAIVTGDARTLEAGVHRTLMNCRLSGEWFDISVDDAVAIVRNLAVEFGCALDTSTQPTAGTRGARPKVSPSSDGLTIPGLPGTFTGTGWNIPNNLSRDEWAEAGRRLSRLWRRG